MRSEVRRLAVVPADAQVAADLQIEAGRPVIAVERLRFVDEEPWVSVTTHLPEDVAPGLVHDDLTSQSLYALLENKYGVRLVRGRRSLEAAVATPALARDLGIARASPILVLRSVSLGVGDRPIETFVAFHRGDRSRFEVELLRQSTAAARPLMIVTS